MKLQFTVYFSVVKTLLNSLLPVVCLAQSDHQLLVESGYPFSLGRPVQDTAGPEHASAQEQGPGQLVVMDVLLENQHYRVPAGLDHLVQGMVCSKSSTPGILQ